MLRCYRWIPLEQSVRQESIMFSLRAWPSDFVFLRVSHSLRDVRDIGNRDVILIFGAVWEYKKSEQKKKVFVIRHKDRVFQTFHMTRRTSGHAPATERILSSVAKRVKKEIRNMTFEKTH